MEAAGIFTFERLKVWQRSRLLAKKIYEITALEEFPQNEVFNLISQMRRSAISVASNIAEGTVRYTKKDRLRFINVSYSSAVELLNQLIISFELEYISEENYKLLRKKIEEICAMLSGLRKATQSNPRLS